MPDEEGSLRPEDWAPVRRVKISIAEGSEISVAHRRKDLDDGGAQYYISITIKSSVWQQNLFANYPFITRPLSRKHLKLEDTHPT
jgi:hypothetical protein